MIPTHPLLQRCALGLWFLGLGALGLLRWWMRYLRDAQVFSDVVMHVWLWGSLGLVAVGAVWTACAFATHRRHRDTR
ncbi:hypothetical protein GOY17_14225 [Lysobacter soli]|uniref:hypothetical protein n=1 Tax=Lysobacter soli TaxID=453783 RepID=UPI0012ED6BA1|nr:hypothetical protein [Lysobacter soli]QGW65959.1 hypothetical protein GOY17_14225 [Lysobacter soli]